MGAATRTMQAQRHAAAVPALAVLHDVTLLAGREHPHAEGRHIVVPNDVVEAARFKSVDGSLGKVSHFPSLQVPIPIEP